MKLSRMHRRVDESRRMVGMRATVARLEQGRDSLFARIGMPDRFLLPYGVEFSQLGLARTGDGSLAFQLVPLVLVCQVNGFDPVAVVESNDQTQRVVAMWYIAHRVVRGPPDAAAEHILGDIGALLTSLLEAMPQPALHNTIRVEREAASALLRPAQSKALNIARAEKS